MTDYNILQMGRGRKSIIAQGKNKKKECGPLPKEDNNFFILGTKIPTNQTIVDVPEEVLNELRQLNPRDIANILVNS